MYKILIVEDDKLLLENLLDQLQKRTPYSYATALTVAEARTKLAQDVFDLIILDVGLPDENGMDFCRELRDNDTRIPIVMLTSHSSDVDIVSGLSVGANDYITKPFRVNVVIARLETQLRQLSTSADRVQKYADLLFDFRKREVKNTITKKRALLSTKEIAIVRLLLNMRGAPLSREQLFRDVWNYHADVDSNTLQTHIYRLRRKFSDLGCDNTIIKSNSAGYFIDVEPAP